MSGKGLKYGTDVWTRISVSFRTGKKISVFKNIRLRGIGLSNWDVDTETRGPHTDGSLTLDSMTSHIVTHKEFNYSISLNIFSKL